MNLYIKDAESRLESALPRLIDAKDSTAICFFLSRFQNNVETSDVSSVAISLIRDHFKRSVGDIYSFSKGDIVVVYKGNNDNLINDIVYQIQYLFSDDDDQLSFPETVFKDCYRVFNKKNWNDFIGFCKKSLNLANDSEIKHAFQGSLIDLFSTIIEDFIQNIKWSNIIINSSVDKHSSQNLPVKVFEEIHIDMDSLSYVIGDGFDIISNTYLRNYFKELLDIKLLIRLVNLIKQNKNHSAFLLSLSINTLRSKEFEELSKSLPEAIRKRIIISISAADVFESLADFMDLREKLISYDYKLCLDKLDYLSFIQLDRKSLGFDLFRISKINHGHVDVMKEIEQQLMDKVKASSSSRVILEASSADDILLGKKLGITLFQTDK